MIAVLIVGVALFFMGFIFPSDNIVALMLHWLGMTFGAAGVAVSIYRLLDPRPGLMITSSGLSGTVVGSRTIVWGAVQGVYVLHLNNCPFLRITLLHPEHWGGKKE